MTAAFHTICVKKERPSVLRLGKLWGVLVVLAVTNLDVLKIQVSFGWTAYGVLLGILLLAFTMVNIAPNWGRQNFSRLGIMLGGETLIEIYVQRHDMHPADHSGSTRRRGPHACRQRTEPHDDCGRSVPHHRCGMCRNN